MITETQILASVVIPSFNYARFLPEAIESALNQKHIAEEQLEIIVVDDGSTDETESVIESYKADRIIYLKLAHLGKAFAVRAGYAKARGKYVFNLDADDVFLPEKVYSVIRVFESYPEVVHVGHPVVKWFEGSKQERERMPDYLCERSIPGRELLNIFYAREKFYGGGSSFSVRADVLKKIPIVDKNIGTFVDEYLLIWATHSGNSFFLKEHLSLYRIHGGNDNLQIFNKEKSLSYLDSKRAIRDDLRKRSSFKEVVILYDLQFEFYKLRVMESIRAKTLNQVLELWVCIFKNRQIIYPNFLHYCRINHMARLSLPMCLVPALKFCKNFAKSLGLKVH